MGVLHLVAEALEGVVEDLVVVERKLPRQTRDREPCRFHRLAARRDLGVVSADQRVVGDDGGLHLARGVAELEGVELL